MNTLSHLDANGNARIVDITRKEDTLRQARAVGEIVISSEVFRAISTGTVKKGDVLTVSRIAGIMAAKQTAGLIPLCHSLQLTDVQLHFSYCEEENALRSECSVTCFGKTGVEMEALTGVAVSLLTIYDMCKAIDKHMVIQNIHLLEKNGGKSGDFSYIK